MNPIVGAITAVFAITVSVLVCAFAETIPAYFAGLFVGAILVIAVMRRSE